MSLSDATLRDLDARLEHCLPALWDLSLKIHGSPELRFEEHQASRWIAELLTAHEHPVEKPLGGLATAFRARAGSQGPQVAILAEYDALPELGHACGHNLIAGAAVGAFLALAPLAEALGGRVDLVGTPAEEGGGGKILLLDAGIFDGVDAAMMFHPFDRDLLAHPALANLWIRMDFSGVPAHAAVAPWDGKSALTACLQTFSLIDSQRVHFRDGVRVHGFILDGGQAVNIIPERASCEFSVRARTLPELERVRAVVERCARAAALALGVEVTLAPRRGYKDLRNNMTLARVFGRHLGLSGRAAREGDDRVGAGSTDMGDISHAVPSIHPWLALVGEGECMCHERAFEKAAGSERGRRTLLDAARALARTAAEFLTDPQLRQGVREEFLRG
ncbi:MAG: M20 family metallopeptidase [Deltaproteobacteria bacterium]|nr:M20 family metallopeptidase [Deltaproteobacteria bacterium]